MVQKLVVLVLLMAFAVSTSAGIEIVHRGPVVYKTDDAVRHFLTKISHEKSINFCGSQLDCTPGYICKAFVCMPEQVAVVIDNVWPIVQPAITSAITAGLAAAITALG
uniref:Uncharacterized protein n=2 Tax=Panagrolaimus sp. JU765 TaxID=591449 RepID=A0AC34QF56_9BILA